MSGVRYTIFQRDALNDDRVTDIHLRLLALFGCQSDRNGWLEANQSVLAAKMKRTRETVNRTIRDLVEWGYLRKKQRFSGKDGRQLICSYQVLMDRDDEPDDPECKPIPCDPEIAPPCDPPITPPVIPRDHTPCDPQRSHHKYDPLLQRPSSFSSEKDSDADGLAGKPNEGDCSAFDAWWRVYPHKVAKAAARRAFATALGKAPVDALIAGVQRYVATKPPDRNWCNPATWLNGERWLDEPGRPPAADRSPGGARASPQRSRIDPLFAICQAELSPAGEQDALDHR